MRLVLGAVLLLSAAASAQAAEPGYIGTWQIEGTPCANGRLDNDGYLKINSKRTVAHESHCTIQKVTRGSTGWTAKLSCSGEGETWQRTVGWSLAENGKLIAIEGGHKSVYKRCSTRG